MPTLEEKRVNEMAWTSTDARFMSRTFRLAAKAAGETSPNPLVGAVVIKNGRIIGEGFHERYGGPHAETIALEQAGQEAYGADLYVNLEPCSHFGNTPPCVDQVIQAGIARVFISNKDPNPVVNGTGLQKLNQSGIKTVLDVLADEGEELNAAYFKFMRTGRPHVTLKWAQSIDGRIATRSGDSRWISGEASRTFTHEVRRSVDAILVGAGTVRQDDPKLTVRHVNGKQPMRLVLDRRLEISEESTIFTDPFKSKTVLITCSNDAKKIRSLRKKGIRVETFECNDRGAIDLDDILNWMGQNRLISLLVEGGQGIITAFLESGLVDKLMVFIAPKLMGSGLEAIGDLRIQRVFEAFTLKDVRYENLGEDLLLEAVVEYPARRPGRRSEGKMRF